MYKYTTSFFGNVSQPGYCDYNSIQFNSFIPKQKDKPRQEKENQNQNQIGRFFSSSASKERKKENKTNQNKSNQIKSNQIKSN
jgi:hypothetical protein